MSLTTSPFFQKMCAGMKELFESSSPNTFPRKIVLTRLKWVSEASGRV